LLLFSNAASSIIIKLSEDNIISIIIYIKCHITCDDVQIYNRITHQQPQIVYNIVNNVAYNNIVKQIPTKIIDLSGELTEDDDFIKEKNVIIQ
jgi:hypothetical protein